MNNIYLFLDIRDYGTDDNFDAIKRGAIEFSNDLSNISESSKLFVALTDGLTLSTIILYYKRVGKGTAQTVESAIQGASRNSPTDTFSTTINTYIESSSKNIENSDRPIFIVFTSKVEEKNALSIIETLKNNRDAADATQKNIFFAFIAPGEKNNLNAYLFNRLNPESSIIDWLKKKYEFNNKYANNSDSEREQTRQIPDEGGLDLEALGIQAPHYTEVDLDDLLDEESTQSASNSFEKQNDVDNINTLPPVITHSAEQADLGGSENKEKLYVELIYSNTTDIIAGNRSWHKVQETLDSLGKQILKSFYESELDKSSGGFRSYIIELPDCNGYSVSLGSYSECRFNELGISLRIDMGNLILEGTPKHYFDGSIELRCKICLNLFVPVARPWRLHTPRSLWKELEPKDDTYPKKHLDYASAFLGSTGKVAIAASRRGLSHAHKGKYRDDHFMLETKNDSGWFFFAVADGAGSKKYSRQGSLLACEKLIDDETVKNFKNFSEDVKRGIADYSNKKISTDQFLTQTNLHSIFQKSVCNAYRAIEQASKDKNEDVKEYSTTLLFAALYKYGRKWLIVTYWIGDGGIVIYQPNGENAVRVMGKPDTGLSAGETRFLSANELTEERIKQRIHMEVLDDFTALFMMTDGITDPFFEAEIDLEKFDVWDKFINETLVKGLPDNKEQIHPGPRIIGDGIPSDNKAWADDKARALLEWMRFYVDGHHDDRTMLIVSNH